MYQEEIETLRSKDDQLIEAMRTTIGALEETLKKEKQDNELKT